MSNGPPDAYFQIDKVTGRWRKATWTPEGYSRTSGTRAYSEYPVTNDIFYPLLKDSENARVWVEQITCRDEDQ